MDVSVDDPKRTYNINKTHGSFSFHIQKIEDSVKLSAECNGKVDDRRKDESSCKKQSSAASVSDESVYES